MKIYVCTYRQYLPKQRDINKTRNYGYELIAFADEYLNGGRYYDWGDDPSFYCSKNMKGKVTWGVCRPNVRKELGEGDVVVFFCVKERKYYFYIGYGIVGEAISYKKLWRNHEYNVYRNYFNVIADGEGQHRERIYPQHIRKKKGEKGWEHRINSPYIIFKDFHWNPFEVAEQFKGDVAEKWHGHTQWLHEMLFNRHSRKSLRTSSTGFAHPAINLTECIEDRAGFISRLP